MSQKSSTDARTSLSWKKRCQRCRSKVRCWNVYLALTTTVSRFKVSLKTLTTCLVLRSHSCVTACNQTVFTPKALSNIAQTTCFPSTQVHTLGSRLTSGLWRSYLTSFRIRNSYKICLHVCLKTRLELFAVILIKQWCCLVDQASTLFSQIALRTTGTLRWLEDVSGWQILVLGNSLRQRLTTFT